MSTKLPASLKRFSSTFTTKPTPSKAHLHKPIPPESFPSGYILTGIHAGIKKKASALDLAVILSTSPRPTAAAACFTRNAFKAAPVLVSEEVLRKNGGRARAVVVNSGCANAVTGAQGLDSAWKMARATDALLGTVRASPQHAARSGEGEQGEKGAGENQSSSETLVMSTGVIGQHVPIASILSALGSLAPARSTLAASFAAWENAAHAFMTTDTFPKLRARTFAVGGRTYRLAGMDKGAGMIHPDMGPARGTAASGFAGAHGGLHATLLACVVTDAPVSPRSLQSALSYAVDRSFNSISVDGDMSTNDTIVALANGAGALEAPEIDEETDGESYRVFRDELTVFTQDLAQLVVRDGEGATKFVKITVKVRMLFLHGLMLIFLFLRARRVTKTRMPSRQRYRHRHWSRQPCTAKMQSTYALFLLRKPTKLMLSVGAVFSLPPDQSHWPRRLLQRSKSTLRGYLSYLSQLMVPILYTSSPTVNPKMLTKNERRKSWKWMT